MEAQESHLKSLIQTCFKVGEFEWTEKEQKAFEDTKRMIQKETMLAYPKFGETFHVYADASDTQLGGVIMQMVSPWHSIPEN